MNIAVAGGTWATRNCIEGLRRNGVDPVVFGQHHNVNVAGWEDLEPDHTFTNVNEIDAEGFDYLFVVGCSQIVGPKLLETTRCIGFHPTRLPKGRGRAPIAWLVLGAVEGAATFFGMYQEPDAGPIYVQEPFGVGDADSALDVCMRVANAMGKALDDWLPDIGRPSVLQDDTQATYLGARKPEDAEIDWTRPAGEIERLVRASGWPYRGAYTHNENHRVKINRAAVSGAPYTGVVGRVVRLDPPLVQTGDGLLELTDIATQAPIKVGTDLR